MIKPMNINRAIHNDKEVAINLLRHKTSKMVSRELKTMLRICTSLQNICFHMLAHDREIYSLHPIA